MDVNYGRSAPFTLGVEEELQLVDATTYDLTSRYAEVFGEAAHLDERIKPELLQSTVEVATEPARTVAEAIAEAGELRRRARRPGALRRHPPVLALRAPGRHRAAALRGARRRAAMGGRAAADLRPA